VIPRNANEIMPNSQYVCINTEELSKYFSRDLKLSFGSVCHGEGVTLLACTNGHHFVV
jgi:hypothetical protein